MTDAEIAEYLNDFNKWRRGDERYEMPNPKELGMVLDEAVARLKAFHDVSRFRNGKQEHQNRAEKKNEY